MVSSLVQRNCSFFEAACSLFEKDLEAAGTRLTESVGWTLKVVARERQSVCSRCYRLEGPLLVQVSSLRTSGRTRIESFTLDLRNRSIRNYKLHA